MAIPIYNRFNKLENQHIYQCFYDIEVMPHNFSMVFLLPEIKRGLIFTIDDFPEYYHYEEIDHFLNKKWGASYQFSHYHTSFYTKYDCENHSVDFLMMKRGYNACMQMLSRLCQVRRFDKNGKPFDSIYEYYGWNSDNYDLPILIYLYAYMERVGRCPKAEILRRISDGIIEEGNRSFWQLCNWVNEESLFGHETRGIVKTARLLYKQCIETQNHVDIGAINEKSKDIKSGAQFMFPLKTIASYCGLDIVEDETTRLDFNHWSYDTLEERFKKNVLANKALTQKALKEMLFYNINDVNVTYEISKEKEYGGTLQVKDGLRQKYSFLLQPDERGRILGRSATMAQISGKIIRGENQNVLVDDPVVDLTYPFEDGTKRNLLDYVAEHEHVHPLMIDFYRQFDGHDMHSREAHYATLAQSITAKDGSSGTTCNIPYMDKNGKALNTYITLSIGGAHGGVGLGFSNHGNKYDNVYHKDMNCNPYNSQYQKWDTSNWMYDFATGSIETCTIDVENVIHADFASYYPSMNIRLGVYVGEDGIDNYKQVRDDRIKVKDSIPSDLSTWTEKDVMDENTQLGMKLTINAATGASNQHKDNVDLPLDNCTTRMRIMGNILIYVLGQRFADEGGFVFSTNTDGLYLTGVSKERAKEICDDFMATYGLSIEPEPLARMINKSANERIEYEHPTLPNRVGGNLGRSTGKRIPLDSNIDYPRACGKAVLDYMSNRRDWLETPISVPAMKKYLTTYLEKDKFNPIDWTITLKGNRNRKFKLQSDELEDGQGFLKYKEIDLSDTNRIAMVKDGKEIVQYFKNKNDSTFKITKIPKITSTSVTILNTKKSLDCLDPASLNVDAYLEWCINLLNVWYIPKTIPELEPERQTVYEQVDLFADLDL